MFYFKLVKIKRFEFASKLMVIFILLNVLGYDRLVLSYLKSKSTSSMISALSAMELFLHHIICLVKLLNVGSFFLMKLCLTKLQIQIWPRDYFWSYSKTLANNGRTLLAGVGGLSVCQLVYYFLPEGGGLFLPEASQGSEFQILKCCFGEGIPMEMLQISQ